MAAQELKARIEALEGDPAGSTVMPRINITVVDAVAQGDLVGYRVRRGDSEQVVMRFPSETEEALHDRATASLPLSGRRLDVMWLSELREKTCTEAET